MSRTPIARLLIAVVFCGAALVAQNSKGPGYGNWLPGSQKDKKGEDKSVRAVTGTIRMEDDSLVEGAGKQPPLAPEYLAARYPHRMVSRAVLLQPREAVAEARQFQITELAQRDDAAPKVVFASGWLRWDEAIREEVR